MTAMERGNYQVAVLASIFFHIALLIFYIPNPTNPPINFDTVGAGLVDMPGGGGSGGGRGEGGSLDVSKEVIPHSGVEDIKQSLTHNVKPLKPVNGEPIGAKIFEKPTPPVILNSSKSGLATEDKPVKEKTPETASSTGTEVNSQANGNSGQKSGDGIGLGDGSGMIGGIGGGSGDGTGNGIGGGIGNGVGSGVGNGVGNGMGGSGKFRAPKNVQNDDFEGEVILHILIKTNGTIEDIHFLKKSGDDRLDNYTRDTIVKNSKFKPNKDPYYIDVSFTYRKNINNYVATPHFLGSKTRP